MILPLSSGLQSTISSVTLNGECDHDPLPICMFNDSDIFISEALKQKNLELHRFGSFADSKLLPEYGIYGNFNYS